MMLLPIALLALPPPPREPLRPALCRSAAYCAFIAREALLDGDLEKAARAGTLQLHFEECQAQEGQGTAGDTLARIELERGAPLRPCDMRFRFTGDSLTVVQDGSAPACGFGGGVDASGEYQRTSREAPPSR